MWRPFFLAIGISLTILGAECFVIERAVMTKKLPDEPGFGMPSANIVLEPPEWAPWTFMTAGIITVIYSLTLTKKG
jgi:hypothetical protein